MSIFQRALDKHLVERQTLSRIVAEEKECWVKWERERQELERRRMYRRSLAAARDHAHFYFDQLWQSGAMTRAEAYRWLSRATGIPLTECHMAQFDIGMCEVVALLSHEKIAQLEFLVGGLD